MDRLSIWHLDLGVRPFPMEIAQQILAGLCVLGAISFAFYQVYSRAMGSKGCGKGCGGCKEKKGPPKEQPLLQITIVGKNDSSLNPL